MPRPILTDGTDARLHSAYTTALQFFLLLHSLLILERNTVATAGTLVWLDWVMYNVQSIAWFATVI